MFLLSKSELLTQEKILKIIQSWLSVDLPRLKNYENYYEGKQKIIWKQATDTGKPCNKIICNYVKSIVENYQGYLTGKPVTYSSAEDISDILEVLNYNDQWTEDSELLKNGLEYGIAYEINYIDESGHQRFKLLPSTECIAVYSNDLNSDLLYVIRLWREDTYTEESARWYVDVYTPNSILHYASVEGFTSLMQIGEEQHYFKQCPVSVFTLPGKQSIFHQIISLQDAYNELLSSEVDDFSSFCDAYLVLKGMDATEDELREMKQHRVLIMDTDSSADYLTKSISDTQIQNMLTNLDEQIYNKANCPNFNSDKFFSQSGAALRYKLLGFENACSAIESQLKKVLQRRIELISAIETLTLGESTWRDIEITFTRNLPFDLQNVAQVVNSLRGLVSNKTLLSLLPFIRDVDMELKQLEEEKQENLSLYNFGGDNDEEDMD